MRRSLSFDRIALGARGCRAVALAFAFAPACARVPDAAPARAEAGSIASLAGELDRMSLALTAPHEATFRGILEDTLAKDPYVCRPSPRAVFFGDAPDGERTIAGSMPHYGFFLGPMRYVVRRIRGRWEVAATIVVDLPPEGGRMELPDCDLARELAGDDAGIEALGAACSGVPYARASAPEACPASGSFSLPVTRRTLRALLERWSREAEAYYNRDAAAFGLPVRYDFTFAEAADKDPARASLRLPLSLTCGRTPYFVAFRSGWSLPIVAHEVGHVLGLLDEYETFSGITRLYPKTPFPGAEVSRMGLSMREGTVVLPLHHYLILRRYFCAEPRAQAFDGGI
jgi:hypothetical protein